MKLHFKLSRAKLQAKEQLSKLFLFVFIGLVFNPTYGANENVGQVSMVQCYQDYCVRLSSDHLQKSSFGDIYAFSKANIFISDPDKTKNKLFSNFEGSFDPTIGRFYLSKKGEAYEYVIDTKYKKVISYKVQ